MSYLVIVLAFVVYIINIGKNSHRKLKQYLEAIKQMVTVSSLFSRKLTPLLVSVNFDC